MEKTIEITVVNDDLLQEFEDRFAAAINRWPASNAKPLESLNAEERAIAKSVVEEVKQVILDADKAGLIDGINPGIILQTASFAARLDSLPALN